MKGLLAHSPLFLLAQMSRPLSGDEATWVDAAASVQALLLEDSGERGHQDGILRMGSSAQESAET